MSAVSKAEAFRSRCNEYIRRALPPDAQVKRLADILGQSRQTAARLFGGDSPTSAQLAALASYFGKDFVAYVFEPVVGEMAEASTAATLARVERLLLSLRQSGQAELQDREAGPPGQRPSTSTRLPLAEISRYPSLLPMLERIRARSGRLELAEAVSLARADSSGKTSVNRRSPGDVLRFVYRGRASRLHPPSESIRDRPFYSMADPVYAQLVARCFEETSQSGEPVLATVSGTVKRGDGVTIFASVVALRTVDRAKDGTLIFSTQFVPAHPL